MFGVKSSTPRVYQIMSEQPDWCGKCGSRLELLEIRQIDGEQVFVSRCNECPRDIFVVEDDLILED